MNLSDKHKSIVLTFLLTGTLIMGMFTFHLKQQNVHDSESYYIIEPKDEADIIQKIKK